MIKQRKIELLAPAKNLECGIEAINHGADAVYIGAPKFGARAAAVNSLEDIEALVQMLYISVLRNSVPVRVQKNIYNIIVGKNGNNSIFVCINNILV